MDRARWATATEGLPPLARALLLELALEADHRTGELTTTVSAWAEELGVGRRPVAAALAALEERGLVTVALRQGAPGTVTVALEELRPAEDRAPARDGSRATARTSRATARSTRDNAPNKGEGQQSSSSPPPLAEALELPVGLEEEEVPHHDPRVADALAGEVHRRELHRAGPPLTAPGRWRARVLASLVADHGPALEAEAARDPQATAEELWARATTVVQDLPRHLPRPEPGCARCELGWLELEQGLAPCPTCRPALAASSS